MLARVNCQNKYVEDFLKTVDQISYDEIVKIYQQAFIPRLTGQMVQLFNDICTEFADDTKFTNISVSQACAKAREIVKKFEAKELRVDYMSTDYNHDFWQFRIEEVFILKLLCIDALKKKNDSLLVNFISWMSQDKNIHYPALLNFPGKALNTLPIKMSELHKDVTTGKVTCRLVSANDENIEKIKSDNEKALTSLEEKKNQEIKALKQENSELKKDISEQKNRIEKLEENRKEMMTQSKDIMTMMHELKKEMAELKSQKSMLESSSGKDDSTPRGSPKTPNLDDLGTVSEASESSDEKTHVEKDKKSEKTKKRKEKKKESLSSKLNFFKKDSDSGSDGRSAYQPQPSS